MAMIRAGVMGGFPVLAAAGTESAVVASGLAVAAR
jgi:hypothetical protein